MSPLKTPALSGPSIRTTIMLFTLVPMLIISSAVCVWFVSFRISDLNESLELRGLNAARQLAVISEYALLTGNRSQMDELAGVMFRREGVRSVSLYDSQRQLMTHRGPEPLEPSTLVPSLTPKRSIYRTDNSFRYAVPIRLGNGNLAPVPVLQGAINPIENDLVLGWAMVELRRDKTEAAKWRTTFIAMIATLATIFLNFHLAHHLTRRLAKPINEINQFVRELENGNLQTRVQVQGGPEIIRLQDGVNAMAESLQKRRRELQQNIDQATDDLRETLETVEVQNIELDIARKKALEASRVKSEFLANMSHEIRTPLNGIVGFTRLLLKSPVNRQQLDQLQTILKSSEILLTIINDVLDFSKIEAGKLTLDYTEVNLQDIVDDVLTMLAPAAHEKDLDLAALVYVDVPTHIFGDPLRIKQILTNLLNNAIKFTSNGHVMLRVMHEGVNSEGRTIVRFTISDTGVGLSRLQQSSLFTPFSQADASTARHHGGTGLGLVISRRLTAQMNGKIGVESQLGKGSTFWVELPVEADECLENTMPPMSSRLAGQRIIYLEQQSQTGMVVESLLRLWESQVTRVDSANELLSNVREAQRQHQGYALAIVGLNRAQLQDPATRSLVHELEYTLDCRLLLLYPTLDARKDPPAYLIDASAALTKPPTYTRLQQGILSLLKGESAQMPLDQTTPSPGLEKEVQQAPRILAVDDNPANLKLIIALLEDMGMNPVAAPNGYEALRCIRQEAFDLAFMDVQMPGMDGIETTQKIRQLKNHRTLPVIALTAHALAEERDMLMSSGFDGYLTKPVNEQQLAAEINKHTGYQAFSEHPSEARPVHTETIKPSSTSLRTTCVDIPACIELAADKADLAEELFSMLLESLPAASAQIAKWHSEGNEDALLEEVHRLHGASRYSGVPALREAAYALETGLKRHNPETPARVNTLLDEIERLQYWSARHDWQQLFRES